jgi:polar amino acid transport system substrate-binding protein
LIYNAVEYVQQPKQKKETDPMRIWLTIILLCLLSFIGCAQIPPVPQTEGDLRIITEVYPPYNFVDKNNEVVGQSTELVEAILKKLDIKYTIEVMPLAEGLALLQKGPNIAVYSLNRTPLREGLFKWVGPVGSYRQAFYVKAGSKIQLSKLEDAKSAGKIGIYKGDAGGQFLVAQGFNNLDESQTDIEALKKLIDNKVQLWLGNAKGLDITLQQAGISPDAVVVLPTIVIQADLFIAFSKDLPDSTISSWQKALDFLKQDQDIDGKTVYDKIQARYDDPSYIQSLLK